MTEKRRKNLVFFDPIRLRELQKSSHSGDHLSEGSRVLIDLRCHEIPSNEEWERGELTDFTAQEDHSGDSDGFILEDHTFLSCELNTAMRQSQSDDRGGLRRGVR